MTSNALSDNSKEMFSIGFASSDNKTNVRGKLHEYFKDEFINRIDDVIVFHSLDISALKQIAEIKVCEVLTRLSLLGIEAEIDPSVFDIIASDAISEQQFGARGVMRTIVSKIENPLASLLVKTDSADRSPIVIRAINDEIIIEPVSLTINC